MIDPQDPGTLQMPFHGGAGALVGYARVSSADQDLQSQVGLLKAAGCAQVFKDVAERRSKDRPNLDKALKKLRAGDTLVVWKVDRIGRSLADLVATVDGLVAKGIGFRSLTEATIDTTAPGGPVMAQVFAELIASERARTRQAEPVKATRGRPIAVTPEVLAKAKELMEQEGMSVRDAASALGISKTPLYRALSAETEAAAKAAPSKKKPRK